MRSATKTVVATCPICSAFVPMFTVVVHVTGIIRPSVQLDLQADASDYVAHMWTHSQGEPAWQ